jgi:hypothetical protein
MGELLTTEQQIALVRERFPELRVVCGWPWLVIWEGPIRSISRAYQVRIFWHLFWPGKSDFEVRNVAPKIFVLDPPLQDRPDEQVPHMYRSPGRRNSVCCWDPTAGEWSFRKSIADTVVPFIVRWLCSYEFWRWSGEWPAPGRHPEVQCQSETSSSSPGPPALNTRAAFVRIGRLTGTFVSSALMAAASGGSSRWLSSQDWNPPTFRADQSPIISITSPARPPAALSHWLSLAA